MIEKHLKDVKKLVRVASGEIAPDLCIRDGDILDVFTGSLFRGNIWVSGSWIAYVGDRSPSAGGATRFIEGKGLVAVPGYIDAHGHADLFYNPATFADFAVTRGSTTVFSDGHDMMNSIGVSGFTEVMKASDGFSLKYLWGVPASYPPYPDVEGGELYSLYDLWHLFTAYGRCVSISEMSAYNRILRNEEALLEKILLARSMGRNVEGHTLGASPDKLNTLVAAGLTSCHESIRPADLKNRIRLGLTTMVRHSSIRSDLRELAAEISQLPPDSIILVSDGIFAGDLVEKGYMDHVIRDAIAFGLKPADAIRMATLNPARYFRLDGHIGSVTPGRIADILLVPSLNEPTPVITMERGVVRAKGGRLKVPSSPFPALGNGHHPFRFTSVDRKDMAIEPGKGSTVPVMEIVDRTVTRRRDMEMPLKGGFLQPIPGEDVRKILFTRREEKKWGKGFVKGFGARVGAIASTIAHETHGLLVLGYDDDDMVKAADTVLASGGGIAIVDKGKILHLLELPLGATMSALPVPQLARELTRVDDLLRKRGSTLDNPLWTMGFLTFTSIVELRLTISGVFDVKKGEIVF